jgi:putative peptidoglycan lipid II flippase
VSWGGIRAAAVGVAAGALVQLVVMARVAFSKVAPYKPLLRIRHPGLRAFAGMAVPTMAYLVVAYLSVAAERIFASGFGAGALSTLSYAIRLFILPAAIVVGSIATVLHTEFSVLASRGEMHELGESFRRGVDLTVLILTPVLIGAIVFSRAIVTAAYGYGKFSNENVETTAATFAAYSLGIIPFALGTLCQRLFYALRIPRMLLIIECANLVVYLIAAPVLGQLFSLPGLALARSCSFLFVGSLSFAVALRKLT